MAIDDSTNYTLTGAQVKDLAARIKAGGGLPLYVQESPGQDISAFYSDDTYTTSVSAGDIYAAYADGATITVFFYNSQLDKTDAARVIKMIEAGSYWLDMIVGGYYCDYKDMTTYWKANNIEIQDVNNGVLTIQHNGTRVQTFSANEYSNVTANIETIWADDIAPATAVPPITNDMIDWSTVVHQVPISDFITMNSGYSIANADGESHVFVCGKVVIAHLVIQASSNFTGSQVTVGTIKPSYVPIRNVNGYGGLGGNQWNLSGICYSYIAINGQILIADHQNTGKSYAKIMASWVIN